MDGLEACSVRVFWGFSDSGRRPYVPAQSGENRQAVSLQSEERLNTPDVPSAGRARNLSLEPSKQHFGGNTGLPCYALHRMIFKN